MFAEYRMIIEPFPKNPVNGLADGLPLRFLFASNPQVMTKALSIIYRTIATHLTRNGQVRYELTTSSGRLQL